MALSIVAYDKIAAGEVLLGLLYLAVGMLSGVQGFYVWRTWSRLRNAEGPATGHEPDAQTRLGELTRRLLNEAYDRDALEPQQRAELRRALDDAIVGERGEGEAALESSLAHRLVSQNDGRPHS